MKVETRNLTDAALDWAVALAKGYDEGWLHRQMKNPNPATRAIPAFSTDHAAGGPILDDANVTTIRADDDYEVDAEGFTTQKRIPQWFAQCDSWTGHSTTTSYEGEHMEPTFMIAEATGYYGPTRLIAGLRSVVGFKLGPVVDVPDALVTAA